MEWVDILDSIRAAIGDAIGEVLLVVGLIDGLANLQFVVDLGNSYSANLITIEEYLIQFVVRMIVLPAISGIVLGLVIHEVRKAFRW